MKHEDRYIVVVTDGKIVRFGGYTKTQKDYSRAGRFLLVRAQEIATYFVLGGGGAEIFKEPWA